MITCNLTGGLGNQLFQIFATIAYSMQSKNPFVLPYVKFVEDEVNRPVYWESFLTNLIRYTNKDGLISNERLSQFPLFMGHHDYARISIDLGLDPNIMLDGYFQSFRYFIREYSRIYEWLDIDSFKSRVPYIDRPSSGGPTVSMHFRMGDYVEKRCYHPVLTVKYYINAVQYILDMVPNAANPRIFIFYEEQDLAHVVRIVRSLETAFPQLEFVYVEPDMDWRQMLLMSKCDHHIIANSTFSWWGAVFSRPVLDEHSREKVVCYPSVWYGHQLYYINVADLFPANWAKIDAYTDELTSHCTCFFV
jgi:hypothetical protein